MSAAPPARITAVACSDGTRVNPARDATTYVAWQVAATPASSRPAIDSDPTPLPPPRTTAVKPARAATRATPRIRVMRSRPSAIEAIETMSGYEKYTARTRATAIAPYAAKRDRDRAAWATAVRPRSRRSWAVSERSGNSVRRVPKMTRSTTRAPMVARNAAKVGLLIPAA